MDQDFAKKQQIKRSQSQPELQPSTPDEILKKELEDAQKKISELTEMSKRALADLANYKKRVEEEKAAFSQFANVALLLSILPVLDNFKRAFSQIPENLKENEWVKGLLAIEKQFLEIFKKQGVIEMESQTGQKFDPHKHEAVMQAQGEKDVVVEELEKGYLLGEKIIRPAKVKVGNGG